MKMALKIQNKLRFEDVEVTQQIFPELISNKISKIILIFIVFPLKILTNLEIKLNETNTKNLGSFIKDERNTRN